MKKLITILVLISFLLNIVGCENQGNEVERLNNAIQEKNGQIEMLNDRITELEEKLN